MGALLCCLAACHSFSSGSGERDARAEPKTAAAAPKPSVADPRPAAADPEPATAEAAPVLGPARQLTFAGRRSGEGYFSADGRQLVFQSEREPGNPFYQIYLMDMQTGDELRVSPGTGKATCGWIHPSGERVLFASTHLDPDTAEEQRAELEARESGERRRYSWDYDPQYELFSADRSGHDLRRLSTAEGYDAEGSWSPDGRQILFASNRHAYARELSPAEREKLATDPAYFIDLYIMDANGENLRRLTHSPGYDGGPFFSPDGQRIVWRRFSEDGVTAEIYSMRRDGSDERQLTRLGAMSWAPFYHPSQDYVVFATNLHGFANFELYMVDAEGRHEPIRVTDSEGFDGLPAFSPDGQQLVWTRRAAGSRDSGSQLFRASWDDRRARELLGLAPARKAVAPALPPRPDDSSATIDVERLRKHVDALTSEEAEGRLTGTPGERVATDYIARAFRAIRLEPAGEDGSYFQNFGFSAGVSLGEANELRVVIDGVAQSPPVDVDWRPIAFSRVGEVPASQVVFAGYGIVSPAGEEAPAIDSYAGLDVRGRWVLMLRYIPANLSGPARQHLHRYSSLRYKAMVARERGARGVLIASGPRSKVRKQLVKLSFDASLAGTSIAAISLSDEIANELLAPSGPDLLSLQQALDEGEALAGFSIEGVRVAADVDLVQERRSGRNVLARLRAARTTGPPIMLGAHADHLGRGQSSSSLARDDEANEIHYGADDNASGVAAMLEAARWLASGAASGKLELQRDVLFAAWSGEELGLLGSSYFAEHLPGDAASADPHAAFRSDLSGDVAAYLNMDMVGRLHDRLALYGAGSSSRWPDLIERADAPIGLSINTQEDAYLPTDSTIFYLKGVPILSAFTGSHEDYHTPRDRPEKLNYEGMRDVTRLMASMTASLASEGGEIDYVSSPPPSQGVARAGLRVYLGTVPDYSDSDIAGLRLSGVVSGGPAEKAGLQGGDVVVAVDGHVIENIYDYTYALDALRVDEPAEIVVLRGKERLVLEIVPASRD